jgi:integrase
VSRGQIIERKTGYTVRVFVGRDGNGKRIYRNQRVTGTKKDAQKVLTAMLRKFDTGDLLLNPSNQTVQDYFEDWLENTAKPRLGNKTFINYRSSLNSRVYPAFGEIKLVKLEPRDIQKLYTEMHNLGLSVYEIHRVLSSGLNDAVAQRLIPNNPCQQVKKPKRKSKEMKAMSQDEIHAFLNAAQDNRMYVYFDLLLSTGMRPSEGLALKWQDFDPVNKKLHIRRTVENVSGRIEFKEPKTKRSKRTINLHDGTVSLLLQHRSDQATPDDLIFPSKTGGPLNVNNVLERNFKPCLLKAGLAKESMTKQGNRIIKGKFRMYDLRHTHATMLLKANVHPKVVSERLGHASISLTLDTYSHILPTMQETAVEALGQAMYSPNKGESIAVFN